jgi:hypothetical protein
MRKNRIRIAAGLAAGALLASTLFYFSFLRGRTANASPVPELLSLLPSGAPTLVYVDLVAMRASSFYQHRPDKSPVAIPNQDYADFIRSTGFDFEKDLDRAVVGSWPPSEHEQFKTVVIAEGRFDRAKIHDYAARKGKVEHQEGHDVFVFPQGDGKRFESLTFLDDHRLAMVSGPSIAPLFAGPNADRTADPVRDRATRVDGAAAFLITHVPPIPNNAGAGQPPATAQIMALARSVQWITVAARPEGDNLRLSVEGECDNSADAAQLKSMLDVLRMFGRADLENPKTTQSMTPATLASLQNLLTTMEFTQAAERVRILLELTPDVWRMSGPVKQQQ